MNECATLKTPSPTPWIYSTPSPKSLEFFKQNILIPHRFYMFPDPRTKLNGTARCNSPPLLLVLCWVSLSPESVDTYKQKLVKDRAVMKAQQDQSNAGYLQENIHLREIPFDEQTIC